MANLGFCGALVASRLIFFTLKRDSGSGATARSKDQGRAALRGPRNARGGKCDLSRVLAFGGHGTICLADPARARTSHGLV